MAIRAEYDAFRFLAIELLIRRSQNQHRDLRFFRRGIDVV
jgi:hypothetical protein